ncbi:glycosyltransferase family 4 protein [Microbacterium sp. LMI1-1-1.1]|uniref:glycosyltransferase family 4 protein n=1 Tax=Microbacterium sp. LMI1-1-1.1 TaxID=3135223 RepID=UPI003466E761
MSRLAPAVTLLGVNYPPEPTGISPYTGAVARGLAERGYRTRVVTTHPHYPDWRVATGYGQWSRNELLDGVRVTRALHYVPRKPSGLRRLLSELSFGGRLLASRWGRPSAVIAVSPALFSSAMAAAKHLLFLKPVPFVVWVQDLYWLGLAETGQDVGRAGVVIRATERWLLRRATKVVVIHDRFKTRVVEDFGVDPSRVEVIRNWTHLPKAGPIDRAVARERRGWGTETVVLHAGNMGVKQGLDNVLDAAQLAADAGENIRFVLLGNGAERDRLLEASRSIPTVEFIAPLPDDEFAEAMAAADVLLVNEKVGVSEMAVPSKLTSYFSTGRPVLAATDIRGITADEIRAAEGGVVVEAGRPEQLLAAALSLGKEPERAEALGANGKKYRETVLDETFAIDRFATLLSLLIDGAKSKRQTSSPTTRSNR